MHDPYADEPTRQFPGPPPDLPPTGVYPVQQRSFVRRHRTPLIIAGAAAAVGLIGGIGSAVLDTGSTPATPAATGTPGVSAPATHRGAAGDTLRGTVPSESGNTWTVRTGTGKTITVSITPKTRFGRKNKSSSAADFPVGAAVVVTGHTHDDSTLTASRISVPEKPSEAPSKTTA